MPLIPLILLFAATASPPIGEPQQTPARHWGRLFISPMGEPFRAHDHNDDPLADWFAQADRNHDGYLTLDEMQQDAERFFRLLDVNHDGEIDPSEISRYENVVAPEIQSGPRSNPLALEAEGQSGRNEETRGRRNGRGRRSWSQRDDNESHQGAARFGLLDLPEPVISADTDFDRGVSLAEFRQAAAERFLALDINHKGRLTLADLENIRPAPTPQEQERVPGEESSNLPQP